MNDGMECESISVVTASCLRAQGHRDPLPAYVAILTRRDGTEISMQVLRTAHLTELIASMTPDSSSVVFWHGPEDDLATLLDQLRAKAVH